MVLQRYTHQNTETANDIFIPKFQLTFNIILLKMKVKVIKYGMIKTENPKYKGLKDPLKEKKEKRKNWKSQKKI